MVNAQQIKSLRPEESIGELLTVAGLGRNREGKATRRSMSLTVPVLALALLTVLSLVARERNYHMTSTGLMVLTGVLAAWFAGLFWMFG
jgi:hypothetical protein